MDVIHLLGSAAGLGLAAGVRLYATVLAVGLGIRLGIFHLNPSLDGLRVLANDWVLIAAGTAYALEFFADKIPWVDSLWDSIHTFIRPLGAAMIGAATFGEFNNEWRWVMALASGGVAFAGHSTKAGTRLAANHSPEPFSNIFLSLGEDVFVAVLSWLAISNPVLVLGFVAAFLVLFCWLAPKLLRLLKLEFIALACLVRRTDSAHVLPAEHAVPGATLSIRGAAGRGVPRLRNSTGWLAVAPDGLHFVARRWFRNREFVLAWSDINEVTLRRRILADQLVVTGKRPCQFDVFHGAAGFRERIEAELARHTSVRLSREELNAPAVS